MLEFAQFRDRALQPGGAITFTCAPPGAGQWMGIDRNLDGKLDGTLDGEPDGELIGAQNVES